MAYKNDGPAKQAFIKKLLSEGFESAEVKAKPSDIIASKNGETWYYEMKLTDKQDKCFGAATLTEWEQAFKTPEHFRFVVAIRQSDDTFEFREYTPAEFMQFSTIPPFKIYFNINLDGKKQGKHRQHQSAITLTVRNFRLMLQLFQQMREAE